jgi:hypothetical protein
MVGVALLVPPVSSRAHVVYVALLNGTWQLCYQTEIAGQPVNVNGQVGPTLTSDIGAPSLAWDGMRVACETNNQQIAVCALDGSSPHCEFIAPSGGRLLRPTWNALANTLIAVHYVDDAKREDADLVEIHPGHWNMDAFLTQTGVQDHAKVSPNGEWVAYTSTQTIAVRGAIVHIQQHLWAANLKTGGARQLTQGDFSDIDPAWSTSGHKLAFSSNRSGQLQIWTIDSSGGNLHQLTIDDGSKTWPTWSPDGKSIMFTMVKSGRYSLWIVDVDGSNLHEFKPFGPDSDVQVRDSDWR